MKAKYSLSLVAEPLLRASLSALPSCLAIFSLIKTTVAPLFSLLNGQTLGCKDLPQPRPHRDHIPVVCSWLHSLQLCSVLFLCLPKLPPPSPSSSSHPHRFFAVIEFHPSWVGRKICVGGLEKMK